MDKNYDKCFEKMDEICRIWAKYKLSLKVRITIAKTFLFFPRFTNLALVLDPNDKIYDNTNIHINTNFTTIFMTHEMSQVFTLILNNGPCMLEGLSLLSYKIHLPNLFAELPNNDISKG